MSIHRLIAILGLMGASALGVELSKAEIENRRCQNCHGQIHMAKLSPEQRQTMLSAGGEGVVGSGAVTRPGLFVPPEIFASSVHKNLSCQDCHAGTANLPHGQKLPPVSCNASCHAAARTEYLQGAHAEAAAKGNTNAPTCASCHGGHDILPKTQRQSRTHPLNIVKVCGDCHQQHQMPTSNGHSDKQYVKSYLESVHGRASTGGLAVAATCADCHGSHRVLPENNAQSTVNRHQVAQTCGKCHVGPAEVYVTSIHGQQLAKGDERAPVCTDCHGKTHAITRPETAGFMLDVVNECGRCHDQPEMQGGRKSSLYETYRRSYHGQVTSLGSTRAARCSDCHGSHDIQRLDAPTSRLNAQNRVETCRRCHAEATAKFAQFQPHADHRDGRRYPLLHGVWLYFVVMMSFAFGFFGLHSLLWLGRSIIERVKHGPHPRHTGGVAIRRFSKVDRVNHALVIVSFFGLALTGLPLLYAEQEWAQRLAEMLGGARMAGLEHRFFAVMLIANFVIHGVGVLRRIRKHGFFKLLLGPTTMGPRVKDFKDCLGMFRWFFRGGKKPAFDRWTYWEKFDYMAEVGGSFIIGLSGLLLWFPQFFAQFMPGWMFNVATIVHGYEALLAVGFIFTIHFFNAHLRLEKFPVDDVMFTGCLPEEEFKEERGAEYERLVANGDLEALRMEPAPRWYRIVAVVMGVVAMTIGTTLVVLIILAGLKL